MIGSFPWMELFPSMFGIATLFLVWRTKLSTAPVAWDTPWMQMWIALSVGCSILSVLGVADTWVQTHPWTDIIATGVGVAMGVYILASAAKVGLIVRLLVSLTVGALASLAWVGTDSSVQLPALSWTDTISIGASVVVLPLLMFVIGKYNKPSPLGTTGNATFEFVREVFMKFLPVFYTLWGFFSDAITQSFQYSLQSVWNILIVVGTPLLRFLVSVFFRAVAPTTLLPAPLRTFLSPDNKACAFPFYWNFLPTFQGELNGMSTYTALMVFNALSLWLTSTAGTDQMGGAGLATGLNVLGIAARYSMRCEGEGFTAIKNLVGGVGMGAFWTGTYMLALRSIRGDPSVAPHLLGPGGTARNPYLFSVDGTCPNNSNVVYSVWKGNTKLGEVPGGLVQS